MLSRHVLCPCRSLRLLAVPVSLQWRCAGLARALLQAPGAVGFEA